MGLNLFGSSKESSSTTVDQTTQGIESSNVNTISNVDNVTLSDSGAISAATELGQAALDNTAALTADTTGKLTDLATLSNNNLTAFAAGANDNLTALSAASLAASAASQAASQAAADNQAALAGSGFASLTNSNNNLAALSGLSLSAVNEGNANGLAVINNVAGLAISAGSIAAQNGFDALNTSSEQSLSVLNNIATEAIHAGSLAVNAVRDTGVFALNTLSEQATETKDALVDLSGYSIAATTHQFDEALLQLATSNRAAQGDLVQIAAKSADTMSDTLGNILTNGQVSMQQSANDGMRNVAWVAGAALVALVVMVGLKS